MRITSSVLEMYKDFRCLCKLRIYFKNQLKNLARFQSRISNCIIMTWHLVNLEHNFSRTVRFGSFIDLNLETL